MFEVISAVRELTKVASILGCADEERRLSLATYLDKIADCIESIADVAEQDRNSNSLRRLCSELGVYGDEASAIIKSVIGHAGDRVIDHINSAQEAPGVAVDGLIWSSIFDSGERRQHSLRVLQDAAGHIRGVANTLRAPQTPKSFWRRIFRS